MTDDADQSCSLYRHFDHDGNLLYVGISNDAERRFMFHKARRSPWVSRAARMTVEHFPSRKEAELAEWKAVFFEVPEFNKMLVRRDESAAPKMGSFGPNEMIEMRKLARLTQAQLADAIGMSRKAIVEMEAGRAPIEKRTEIAVRYVVEKLGG